jgi:hypothetical protein
MRRFYFIFFYEQFLRLLRLYFTNIFHTLSDERGRKELRQEQRREREYCVMCVECRK